MPIDITGLFQPSDGAHGFNLYSPQDIEAGNIDVVLTLVSGGKITANGILGKIVVQTGAGAPSHAADEGTPYWDTTGDAFYVNNNGSTAWTAVGAAAASFDPIANAVFMGAPRSHVHRFQELFGLPVSTLVGRSQTGTGFAEGITLDSSLIITAGALGVSGFLGLARGGTGADLSGTGGANQFVKQSSSGAGLTVGTISVSDLPISDGSTILANQAFKALPRAHTHSALDLVWGTLPSARLPALTGDVTTTIGTVATTLASVISAGGPTGSATVIPVITWDAKGRLTAVTTAALASYQPLDATLTALAALDATTGILTETGADAFARGQLSGDVTTTGSSLATTLASIITAGGPTGSSTVVPVITWDAKGRLTAVTTATVAALDPIANAVFAPPPRDHRHLHSTLINLTADDHTQYLLAAGTRVLTANWLTSATTIRMQFGDTASYVYSPAASSMALVSPSLLLGIEGNCDFGGSGGTSYAFQSKVDLINDLGQPTFCWRRFYGKEAYLRSSDAADGFYAKLLCGDLTGNKTLTISANLTLSNDLTVSGTSSINQNLLTTSTVAAFAKLTVDSLSLDGTTLASTGDLTISPASGNDIYLTPVGTSAVVNISRGAYLRPGASTTYACALDGTAVAIAANAGNTAGATTVIGQFTLYADSFEQTGDMIDCTAYGTIAATAAVDKQITVKFGSTTMVDFAAMAITVASTWLLKVMMFRDGSSSQRCVAHLQITTDSTGVSSKTTIKTGTAAEATNADKVFALTGKGTNANDVVLVGATCRVSTRPV